MVWYILGVLPPNVWGDLILSSGPFPRLTGGASGNTLNPTGPGRRQWGKEEGEIASEGKVHLAFS